MAVCKYSSILINPPAFPAKTRCLTVIGFLCKFCTETGRVTLNPVLSLGPAACLQRWEAGDLGGMRLNGMDWWGGVGRSKGMEGRQ